MIVLSNTTAQTVNAGQAITFNNLVMHSGNGECYKKGTNSVKLRNNGVYEISFSANIGGGAGVTSQLNIQLGGSSLAETTMISTTGTAGTLNNVYGSTYVRNCCCDFDRVTIVNTGAQAVTIGANPCLKIKRVA
jgi:hypothetical protein